VCAGSKEFKHLKVFEICRKECVQVFSKRLRVMESSEGSEAFKVIEGRKETKSLKFVRRRSDVEPRRFSEEETDGQNSLRRIHEVP
jgi:hypothetical protein